MDASLIDTAKQVGRLAARHAQTVAPKPTRWVPYFAAVAGVGLLFIFASPLLRVRPARKAVQFGAGKLLSKIASR